MPQTRLKTRSQQRPPAFLELVKWISRLNCPFFIKMAAKTWVCISHGSPAGKTVTLTRQSKELLISCSRHSPRPGEGAMLGSTQTFRPRILQTSASAIFQKYTVQYSKSFVVCAI